MTDRKGDWLCTYTGRRFWPLDPRPEEVFVEDIAHALANLCRYGGHCQRFYSVAEHSVLASRVVLHEHALAALLHDAQEAYVCDVPRPLKKHLAGYDLIERVVWRAVADRFGLPHDLPPEVKHADDALLIAECHAVMNSTIHRWELPDVAPAEVPIIGWPPAVAERMFLGRFREVTGAG